ncbi:excalibur calcium-binding domain-containing protein [Erythrobacter sp. EC-HK427]|uniref:excalibur calcium-binding domain-containing protein n=1 Tax=Erythrobacter sp. EC-HK427 TaxID=2038396 RepID=UPI00125582D5|nr:excalibur calcium-binding domain-containing protein [Erythrobacter sp. EC-HK427]VVS96053.1 hypothetical protein ERY430_30010 [Erythrobacter sp. EC-HK427]
MAQKQEGKFGWGALLAAGFGGMVVGNMMNDQPEAPDSAYYAEQQPSTFADLTAAEDEPVDAAMPLAAPEAPSEPEPAIEPPPAYIPPPEPAVSVYFRNCSDARASGAAPVYRGSPGYGSHLDRDNDGVGCE